MVTERVQKAVAAITSLGDPVRRSLYDAVAASGEAISRNEAAKMTGVARPLAAYHLDRLVKEGLLSARFERQTGRVGPGAGRPAKLYFRPREPVQVTLPPRDYEMAALVLVEAVGRRGDAETQDTLNELARERGSKLARDEIRLKHESETEALTRLLIERGYEPTTNASGAIWLRNCVFDELAEKQRELVCGMNLSLLQGMLDALPGAAMTARLQPEEGRCCVVLTPAEPIPPND